MRRLSTKRKVVLAFVLVVVVAAHVWLFAAGGSYRTAGMILVGVDVVSGLFIMGAIKEFRKLEEK